ncbi:hypothetical protein NST74_16875 [Paenibacillus sp. FSL F4-0125]|uniref:hypothetical protein n=1 Tax=Paenibacillus sp. FSL F4-0125 TaxID=2954730 RepID=UPI0030F88A0C
MNFETVHASFIQYHLQKRSGERKGRLERGHREAEKLFCRNVWWSHRLNFDDLHPEFEVLDWRGQTEKPSYLPLDFKLFHLHTTTSLVVPDLHDTVANAA